MPLGLLAFALRTPYHEGLTKGLTYATCAHSLSVLLTLVRPMLADFA